MVSFRQLSPADVTRATRAVATPQAADNQWMPLSLMRGAMVPKRFKFFRLSTWFGRVENLAAHRDRIAQIEVVRSLLDTSKIILNRAAIYNHPVFQSWIIDGTEKDLEALAALIDEESLVIFYLTEREPLEWPLFSLRRDNAFKASWIAFVNRFDRFPGLKLAWDLSPSQERELVKKRLSHPFAYKINGLNIGNMSLLMRDLQLPPERLKARELRSQLENVGRFIGRHFDEYGVYPTREALYNKFIIRDRTKAADLIIDHKKPFSVQLKQLFDLAYNVNFGDAVQIFATSPNDSLNRAALQELRIHSERCDTEFQPHDFIRILKNIVFEAVRDSVKFSGLGHVTPHSIYKIRKSAAYQDYIIALEQFIDATPETLGPLFTSGDAKALQKLVEQRKSLAREISALAASEVVQHYVENAVIFLQSAGVTIKIVLSTPPFRVEVDGLEALRLAAPPVARVAVKLGLGVLDSVTQHDFSSVYELVTYRTSAPYEDLREIVRKMDEQKSFFDVRERGAEDEFNEEAIGQSADRPASADY